MIVYLQYKNNIGLFSLSCVPSVNLEKWQGNVLYFPELWTPC